MRALDMRSEYLKDLNRAWIIFRVLELLGAVTSIYAIMHYPNDILLLWLPLIYAGVSAGEAGNYRRKYKSVKKSTASSLY
jgi:hypothetical protein